MLKEVGLSPDVMGRYPHQFSGGQQQRLCIGRAIALEPELIICDEVISSLDVSIQAQILNLLAKLQEELNLSYLFISHDLKATLHFSDFVSVMSGGRIVESGTTEKIFREPEHAYTRQLLSE